MTAERNPPLRRQSGEVDQADPSKTRRINDDNMETNELRIERYLSRLVEHGSERAGVFSRSSGPGVRSSEGFSAAWEDLESSSESRLVEHGGA